MLHALMDEREATTHQQVRGAQLHALPRREIRKTPGLLRAPERGGAVRTARRAASPGEGLAGDGQAKAGHFAPRDALHQGAEALQAEQVEAPDLVEADGDGPEHGDGPRDAAGAPEEVHEERTAGQPPRPGGSTPPCTQEDRCTLQAWRYAMVRSGRS